MTRTDVMASSRPQTAGVAPKRTGSSRILRRLAVLPVLALLGLALVPGAAFATGETKSSYGTEPSTKTTPATGTLPSKEEAKPTTTPSNEAAPTTTTSPTGEKATTLPFTGFDLRWDVGFGVLLILAGFSIVAVQRRQRRTSRR
jgi:hypothetical protein